VNSFIRFRTLTKIELIKLWLRIIDPYHRGSVKKEQYIPFLIKLSRGTLNRDETLIQRNFVVKMLEQFESTRCINLETEELSISTLRQMLLKNVIDIEVINNVLVWV